MKPVLLDCKPILYFLSHQGSSKKKKKITADSDYSREMKRHLLLGRKALTNLESVFKSRDFASKGPYSQSYDIS